MYTKSKYKKIKYLQIVKKINNVQAKIHNQKYNLVWNYVFIVNKRRLIWAILLDVFVFRRFYLPL